MSSVATIPFQWNVSGKATTAELERGDLLVSGWAIRFDEVDRESEAWDGSSETLWRSVQRFVAGNAPLAHHHDKTTMGIGRVLEAERVPGVGIRVKAVIDYQSPSSPWRHIYDAARRGRLARFSFSGLFKRRITAKGAVIEDADLIELSICGASVGKGTSWSLLAQKAAQLAEGKAIAADGSITDVTDAELDRLLGDLSKLRREVAALGSTTKATGGTMDYATAAVTYADPLGHIESQQRDWTPEERRRIAEQARQEEIRRGEERPDGVTTHYADVSGLDLIGRTPRNKYGELVREDAHEAIRQHEDAPSTLSGDELNAMLGVPRYVDPGRSPEAVFAEEARKQKHEDWKRNLRNSFDAALRRTEKS